MFTLLALTPIAVVLYLMIGRNWGGHHAGLVGWGTAVFLALLAFGGNLPLLLVATGRALLLALYVLYIIWMALLLYHVVNDAGAIAAIGEELPKLAHEQGVQVLLLAWVFGSFLQGASGFGVPAAVVAPLLVGLGFAPTVAVTAALLGHAWAISFGSLGSSFFSLMAASGMEGAVLAGPSALYLGVACLACGAVVLWMMDGWKAIRAHWGWLVSIGLLMGAVQWGLAAVGLYSLAAFGAGLAGMGGMILLLRWQRGKDEAPIVWRNLGRAIWPYALMTLVIVVGQLFLDGHLDWVVLNYDFPAVQTSYGRVTAEGGGRSVSLFGHPGALLFYASLLAFGWYLWRGTLPTAPSGVYSGRAILRKTINGSGKSTVSIVALVGMATVMEYAGMTQLLAEALSNTGVLFPFLSPFIGALGAFMTGSNTNSNVVFTDLQRQTAVALNLTVPMILAAQNAGGALGSIFAPAKVIVGCSTVKGADDAAVLKLATLYGVFILALLGLLTLVLGGAG